MKRDNNLMERITDPENLRFAFWKASKGKRSQSEVLAYQKVLDYNLQELRNELISGAVEIGNYRHFTIKDPKERTICAAPFKQRVLHHALMNICHDNFEQFQIFHSYASRKGKGTYAAIAQAERNQRKYDWFVKLDIRKHFDNIDQSVLLNQLSRRFKENALLDIFKRIIHSYSASPGKGLPIGNLTSQYFANHYLGFLDHFINEKLNAPAYIRYMDDMVIWSNDLFELKHIIKSVSDYLSQELLMLLKPICLNKSSRGLPFCGYVIYPDKTHLNNRSRKRYKKKLRRYSKLVENGLWDQNTFQSHVAPLIAFTRHADAFHYRLKCLQLES